MEELEKNRINMAVKQLEKYLLMMAKLSEIKTYLEPADSLFPSPSPFSFGPPQYSPFTQIGTLTIKTIDNKTVIVDIVIAYDLNDQNALAELETRTPELRKFVEQYFGGKYSSELSPDDEVEIKREILEQLNSRVLRVAKARIILFNQLDVF